VRLGKAAAHPFELSCVGKRMGLEPYWRDVGTIDAYWDANIDLTATDPLLNLYDTRWPIWTYQPQLPPAKFVHNQEDRRGMAIESTVSGGCIVSGSIFRSLLFSQVRVHSYSTVSWSVLLPSVTVGRGARLHRVVSTAPADPRWHGDRREPGRGCQALLPHRKRHRAGHPRDAGHRRARAGLEA
jgi:glucose-1-phosphate adenylyltransferase